MKSNGPENPKSPFSFCIKRLRFLPTPKKVFTEIFHPKKVTTKFQPPKSPQIANFKAQKGLRTSPSMLCLKTHPPSPFLGLLTPYKHGLPVKGASNTFRVKLGLPSLKLIYLKHGFVSGMNNIHQNMVTSINLNQSQIHV